MLKPGDVIRLLDGTAHLVQYVNSAGAYIVPLVGVNREINGRTVTFNAGGKTISAHSLVERVKPEALGGYSQEYKRYVSMVKSLEANEAMAKRMKGKGVNLGEFDQTELADGWEGQAKATVVIDGQEITIGVGTSAESGEAAMAKSAAKKVKAKAKANGAAKSKAPKTVRDCVCGCKTQTTGFFAPGHDARVHGWIKKLAAGKMKPSEIPAAVRNGLNLQETKEGFKARSPHYWQD
jgi:hypothetical protein